MDGQEKPAERPSQGARLVRAAQSLTVTARTTPLDVPADLRRRPPATTIYGAAPTGDKEFDAETYRLEDERLRASLEEARGR
jgi:hypothetical protein